MYMRHIRPVLFKNYHLLDEQIRRQVRIIDNHLQLKRWGMTTEEDVSEHLEYMYYVELIDMLEHEYQSFK
ncbi:hypothetical protein [Alicyclobacillus dauci]|uniref:Fur-regulated basic protein A n=1 Tax=Alicyclobacillus dauci TaxID=1475485 RepID=A0ABY6Z648_9BACL|nr:hypothetical protein [Alicyclobacillus dauci]WAH38297.1 hypothetical protein NZD86_07385 [Alicyclobacillus dauci]